MNCCRHILQILGILLLLLLTSTWQAGAQSFFEVKELEADTVGKTKIEILNADSLVYRGTIVDAKRLIGNVQFLHDSVYMDCDSAWFYSQENAIDAFSNIHIRQGDTLDLYGDTLYYTGNNKLARMRGNVELVDKEITLYTDHLDYKVDSNIAHYFEGGRIVDSTNVLTSELGYYFSNDSLFFFKDSVHFTNERMEMFSDTLKYHTVTEIVWFFGPTHIISDSNYIYCENGWYNTISDISQYNKNAYLIKDNQYLAGDSLYYDRNLRMGRAFDNVEFIDTTENVMLYGNFGEYHELTEFAYLVDSAMFAQVNEGDTLYLHGDTLISFLDSVPRQIPDTQVVQARHYKYEKLLGKYGILAKDTIRKSPAYTDSIYAADSLKAQGIARDSLLYYTEGPDTVVIMHDTIIMAKTFLVYHKVKFYQPSMQGMCDSLSYSYADSVFYLYHDPVLWSEENQLTAILIEMHTRNNEIDYVLLKEASFIASQEDSIRFNQIKGALIRGEFVEEVLVRVDVTEDSETIYYIKDGEEIQGPNQAMSNNMQIRMSNEDIEEIVLFEAIEGTMYPKNFKHPTEMRLENFRWLKEHRPLKKNDVYIWEYKSAAQLEAEKAAEEEAEKAEEESPEDEKSDQNTKNGTENGTENEETPENGE